MLIAQKSAGKFTMSIDMDAEYRKAETAYMQGKYAEAATIIDLLAANFPNSPRIHLFRGYIYSYGLEDYTIAREEYELVLVLAPYDPEFINTALREILYIENLLRTRQNQT